MKKLFRDLTLVTGGALIALSLHPQTSLSNNGLDAYSGQLIAIAKAIRVDGGGNVVIKSNGSISLSAAHIKLNANGALELRSTGVATLGGRSQTVVGSGGSKSLPVTTVSTIICPGPGAKCTIIPSGANVVLAQ